MRWEIEYKMRGGVSMGEVKRRDKKASCIL